MSRSVVQSNQRANSPSQTLPSFSINQSHKKYLYFSLKLKKQYSTATFSFKSKFVDDHIHIVDVKVWNLFGIPYNSSDESGAMRFLHRSDVDN